MQHIYIKSGRDWNVINRHPWLFSGAIDELRSPNANEISSGETVEVISADGCRLGEGWYAPASKIRLRFTHFGNAPDTSDITSKVGAAVGRRADFFANAYTNALRLVNAESDGLPGVVADYYNGFVVLQLTSAGADLHREEIAAALMRYAPGCRGVSERLDLKDREKEGLTQTENTFQVLLGEAPPETIEITEGPCKFLVDVRNGHKTGFYLDQRDARMLVGSLANGREVLNCFSYTGGFGLFARACGATKVTQVDISAEALALAKKNEQLVHCCGTAMEYVEADVFDYLRKCRDEGRKFDMIVLDPPKFAATKSQLLKAARGYKDINLLAMKLLNSDGHLATFSCSGAMTPAFFDQVLTEAATDAERDFQVIARTRQGLDHPVALSFPEGYYLKGVIMRAM